MRGIRHSGALVVGLVLVLLPGLATVGFGSRPAVAGPTVVRAADSSVAAPIGQATSDADDWPMAGGNAARTNSSAGPGVANDPAVRWRFLPPPYAYLVGPPVAKDGVVYIVSDDRVLYALDAATGAERWHFEGVLVDEYEQPQPALAVADDTVFVGGIGRVASPSADAPGPPAAFLALDAATGRERWRLELGEETALGYPVVDGDAVYLDAGDVLVALDAATGDERWRYGQRRSWVSSAPAVAGGIVYVTVSVEGERDSPSTDVLVALDAGNGGERWRFPLDDGGTIGPAVADGTVYVVAHDFDSPRNSLYALDAATGAERSSFRFEGFPESDLAVAAGLVYVGLRTGRESGELLAVDAATGAERWRVEGAGGQPVVAGDTVYGVVGPFAGRSGAGDERAVVALDAAIGEERWRLEGDGAGVIVAGDSVYGFGRGGLVAMGSSPVAGTPAVVTPTSGAPGGGMSAAVATPRGTPAAGATGEVEVVLTKLSCPEWVGPNDVATEFLADVTAAELEAQGCRRAAADEVLFALLAVGPEGSAPREVARGWTDANGEVALRGTLVPDARAYQIDEQDFANGTSSRSEPLAARLAASYAVVNHDDRGYANLSIRALTCPAGTADPVASCRDNRVDRRIWDEFDVRPSTGGGFSEADPSFVDVETIAGPVTIAARPAVFNRYAGAYVSCLDEATGAELFGGEASDDGIVSVRLPAEGTAACEWYYQTAADGATPSVPATPPAPSTPGRVDAPGIWVTNLDGGGLTNLIAGESTARFPAWSPDGERIAFLAGKRRQPQLHVVNVDGSRLRRLADLALANVPPSWSPDGRTILVAGAEGGVYAVAANGSGERLLADLALADVPPIWSPDGQTVLVVAADGGIYAAAADGSGATKLLDQGDLSAAAERFGPGVRKPAWSPDGGAIAVPALAPDGETVAIYLMGADGSGRVPLTDLPDDAIATAPSWSPDGENVAFVLQREGEEAYFCGTVVVNADGSRLRQVDPCGDFSWSPDGTKLLIGIYLGDGGAQLDVAKADGSSAVTITGQVSESEFVAPSWSPDGRRIAYLNYGEGEPGAWVMNADGSGPVPMAVTGGGSVGISSVSWSPDGARLALVAVEEEDEGEEEVTEEVVGPDEAVPGEDSEVGVPAIEDGEQRVVGDALVVEMVDNAFIPEELAIPANADTRVILPNAGAAPHNFNVDALGVHSPDVEPGATAEVTINAPPGEYGFYCSVPGHKKHGMVGILIVEEAGVGGRDASFSVG